MKLTLTQCSTEVSCQFKVLKFRTDTDLAGHLCFWFLFVCVFTGALLSRELKTFSFPRANQDFHMFVRPCIHVQIKISQ